MSAATRNRDVNAVTRNFEGQQGFTLVETTIALVVMMVVGLGAASLFVYAMGSNSTARDRELSMAVAQQQLEFLRNAPFSEIDARVTSSGGTNKTVISAERQYGVVTTIAGDTTQKSITVEVTPIGTNTSGLTAIQKTFGGVKLVTQRSTDALGSHFNN